jgi:hypothetical protein
MTEATSLKQRIKDGEAGPSRRCPRSPDETERKG